MSTDTELSGDQNAISPATIPSNTNSPEINPPDTRQAGTADYMKEQLAAIEIPANIDPRLLALWLYRERQEIENLERKDKKRYVESHGRSLARIFAAFTGVVVMMTMILLGVVQGKEVNDILVNTCIVFLVYTVLGFFVGYFFEGCVSDSVETLLREIVERNKNNDQS